MVKENCAAGCPCSDFDCVAPTSVPTTTTTTITTTTTTTTPISPTGNAVLVLSDYRPFIVDFNGKHVMLFRILIILRLVSSADFESRIYGSWTKETCI